MILYFFYSVIRSFLNFFDIEQCRPNKYSVSSLYCCNMFSYIIGVSVNTTSYSSLSYDLSNKVLKILKHFSMVYLLLSFLVSTLMRHINALLFKKLGSPRAYDPNISIYTSYRLSAVSIVLTKQSRYPLFNINSNVGLELCILTRILLMYISIFLFGGVDTVGLLDK